MLVAVTVILVVLGAVGIFFAVNAYENYASKPKGAVLLGASASDCGSVSFHVQNQDNRILHGWSVAPTVTPSDPHIQTSPSQFQIEPLAPRGNSSQYTFNISFTGAPSGIYQVQLELLNGSATIATSESLNCNVK